MRISRQSIVTGVSSMVTKARHCEQGGTVKTVEIVIEVPLPDEGTQKDAEVLAKYIEQTALTTNPTFGTFLGTPKVFGKVIEVVIKNPKRRVKAKKKNAR